MKFGLILIVAVAAAIVLLTAGCGSGGGPDETIIPSISLPPTTTTPEVQYPDDLILVPGGWQYRASVRPEGKAGPTIPIASANLTADDQTITVTFRADITTNAGQVRNNLVIVSTRPYFSGDHTLELYAAGVPAGFYLTRDGPAGLQVSIGTVLRIDIGEGVSPGDYAFSLGIRVDGTDYGIVPEIVHVVTGPVALPTEITAGTLIPYGGSAPNGTQEYPDDLVSTPGGPAYRGYVETALVPLSESGATGMVQYRADITTNAGQVRNNLVVFGSDALRSGDHTLDLYAAGVPDGFVLFRGCGAGLPGQIGAQLQISIATDVAPGDYSFTLGLVVDSVFRGSLPVTIHVVSAPTVS